MSFRRKLIAVFALAVFLSVAGVAGLILQMTRNAFEKTENQQTVALVDQIQREFSRQGEEVVRRVEGITTSDSAVRMATALNGTSADSAAYFDLAHSLAESHQLDFLEILDWRGTIISSEQWPAKFSYADAAFDSLSEAVEQPAFLKLEELPDSTALGLFSVRSVHVGDHSVYVIGGRRLDKNFLSTLNLAPDMRVLLYQNRGEKFSTDFLLDPLATGKSPDLAHPADKFAPLVDAARNHNQEMTGVMNWSSDQADKKCSMPYLCAGREKISHCWGFC